MSSVMQDRVDSIEPDQQIRVMIVSSRDLTASAWPHDGVSVLDDPDGSRD